MAEVPLTFTIDGKQYKASWSGQGQPSPKDLEEIEVAIRQKYGLGIPKAVGGANIGAAIGANATNRPRGIGELRKSESDRDRKRMESLAQVVGADKKPVTRVHDPLKKPDLGVASGASAGARAGVEDPYSGKPRITSYDPVRHGAKTTESQQAQIESQMEEEIIAGLSNEDLGKHIEETYQGSKAYETVGNVISGSILQIRDKLMTERQRRLGQILGNDLPPVIRQVVAQTLNIPERLRSSAGAVASPEASVADTVFGTMDLLGAAMAAGGLMAGAGNALAGVNTGGMSQGLENVMPIVDNMAQAVVHGITKLSSPLYNKAAAAINKSNLRWAVKEAIKDELERGQQSVPIEDLLNPKPNYSSSSFTPDVPGPMTAQKYAEDYLQGVATTPEHKAFYEANRRAVDDALNAEGGLPPISEPPVPEVPQAPKPASTVVTEPKATPLKEGAWREVKPGEGFEAGREFKMDMSTGKNYVKVTAEEAKASVSIPKKPKGVSNATKSKTTEVPTEGVLGEKGPEVGLPQTGKGAGKGGAQTQKAQSKIKAKLAEADKDFQDAWAALQKERRAQKPLKKNQGAMRPLVTRAELDVAKAWARKNGWTIASSAEDFVKHMVEFGEEAAPWRRVAAAFESELTSPKNARTTAERGARGKPPIPKEEPRTWKEVLDLGKATIDRHKNRAANLTEQLQKKGKPISDVDHAVLTLDRGRIKAESRANAEAAAKPGADLEALAAEDLRLEREWERNDIALTNAGRETARSLASRKMQVHGVSDWTKAELIGNAKLAKKGNLTETERKVVEDIFKANQDLSKNIESRIRTRVTADAKKARETLRLSAKKVYTRQEKVSLWRSELGKIAELLRAPVGMRSDLTALGIGAEYTAKLARAAPHIKNLTVLTLDLAYNDAVSAITKALKKIDPEFDETGVQAVMGGHIKSDVGERELTDYQKRLGEARKVISDELSSAKQAAAEAKAAEREAIKQGKRDAALEAARLKKEAGARFKEWQRMEREHAADVKRFESDMARVDKKMRAADRKRYVEWWKDQKGSRIAQIMNQTDAARMRLEKLKKEGWQPRGPERGAVWDSDPEIQKLIVEREAARESYRQFLYAQMVARDLKDATAFDKFLQVLGGFRGLKASIDVSAPFYQGGWAMFGDPQAWTKAWRDTFTLANTTKGYDEFVAKFKADAPRYNRLKAAKVDLPIDNVHPGEEMFLHGNWSERVPGVKWSERQYGAYLTALRANMFDNLVRAAQGKGLPLTIDELRVIGKHVNQVTGRSQFIFKDAPALWSHVLFAPKFWGSILETASHASFWSAYRVGVRTGNWRPAQAIARQTLQSNLAVFVSYAAASVLLGNFTDYRAEWRPSHTDWGRATRQLPDGSTHTIDVLPPQFQQGIRTFARMLGMYISASGKETTGAQAIWDDLSRQFSGKLAPGVSFYSTGVDAAWGKDQYGKSYDITTGVGFLNWFTKAFFPISVEGGVEIAMSPMSPLEKAILLISQTFGKGGSVRQGNALQKSSSKVSVGTKNVGVKTGGVKVGVGSK